jgi:hypothetical protein
MNDREFEFSRLIIHSGVRIEQMKYMLEDLCLITSKTRQASEIWRIAVKLPDRSFANIHLCLAITFSIVHDINSEVY